jgi:spermidine synthase
MNSKFYIAIYSLTLLLSASLLFIIQPLFSKMVLPLLGGTPQVWNTAMLFFQLLLLAGYAYAHITTKLLTIRSQAMLHISLLLVFFFVLPIGIPAGTEPPVSIDPTFWQLTLMTLNVGGPFFVLSGSTPLFQRWFSRTKHKDAQNPYFLYGASNLGSMSALLLYPTLIEPYMNLTEQSQGWMYAYIGLLALTLLCALMVWKTNGKSVKIKSAISKEVISWSQRGKWLLLAFIPSSLMLGVTAYITIDIASVPLLWIIPLALYLGTFIIVFARKQIISEKKATGVFDFLLLSILVHMLLFDNIPYLILLAFHLVLFFFAALVCHLALASSKPSAEKLTEFYLMMSIGGALGGVFNVLIAPNIFTIPLEYALALGLAVCMRFVNQKQEKVKLRHVIAGAAAIVAFSFALEMESMLIKVLFTLVVLFGLGLLFNKRWAFGMIFTLLLLISSLGGLSYNFNTDIIYQERNFFGVIQVVEYTKNNHRILSHGTTMHGLQSLDKKKEHTPLSYYSSLSPIADMFKFTDQVIGAQKVAVLGLGIGATACYYKKDRSFDFFEINPGIISIAENPQYFTYLSGCGSPYNIITGDARLTLANKEDKRYDFILADTYSSDNIPIHLVTLEAVKLYLQKLKPEGLLGFHISNRCFDMEPVFAEISTSLGITGYAKFTLGQKDSLEKASVHAFVFARNAKQEKFLQENGWTPARKRIGVGLWTDQFSNIMSVLSFYPGRKHIKENESKEKDY